MTTVQLLKNLQTPDHPVDVVLDTDAYNEIDDQFAISYMLRSPERLNVKGLCAAPFFTGVDVVWCLVLALAVFVMSAAAGAMLDD